MLFYNYFAHAYAAEFLVSEDNNFFSVQQRSRLLDIVLIGGSRLTV